MEKYGDMLTNFVSIKNYKKWMNNAKDERWTTQLKLKDNEVIREIIKRGFLFFTS